jgi:hypothetical protein
MRQLSAPTERIDDIISRIEQEGLSKPRYPMFEFDENQAIRVKRQVSRLVDCNMLLPNGKGRRSKLKPDEVQQLRLDLIVAVGLAASLVIKGQLKNRTCGRGRPPDNVIFIFIDDLTEACRRAGLKPGLRFVRGSESLPVRLYVALAPILGFGRSKSPRKLFERWKRLAPTLYRETSRPATATPN